MNSLAQKRKHILFIIAQILAGFKAKPMQFFQLQKAFLNAEYY